MAEQLKEKKQAKKILDFDKNWDKKLAINNTGNYAKTIDNICIILEHEYNGKIFLNELSNQIEINKKNMETVDYDKIQRDIERKFGIYDVKKLSSAIRIIAENNSYHPVVEYLKNLEWDGINRIETILEDYLGTKKEEREYNAMALRLFLFGAIERVLNPGCKFDYMTILNGTQGIGKSTFFKIMCGEHSEFYQEDFDEFEKSFEYTNGKWIVEIGELSALKKADMNFLKKYITDTSETHRVPYEPIAKNYKRQFVLYGTTNDSSFIPDDPTGGRRWIIIEGANDKKKIKKSMFEKEGHYEIQQVLAEIYNEYKNGKSFLTVPKEWEETVLMKNKLYRYDDGLEGIIENYLENKDFCCTHEVYSEAIQKLNYVKWGKPISSKIHEIIIRLPGWRIYTGSKDGRKTFKNYGKQLAFENYGKQERIEENKRQAKENYKKRNNENINKIMETENEDYFMKVGENNNE